MQTSIIRVENMPVRILNGSVGLVFSTVDGDCFGLHQTIRRTISGMRMPVATMIEGVAVQSLKKHIIRPRITKANTATVPAPSP